MNTSPLIDELNRQYQTTISLPEKAFFVGIANYVRFVLDNSDLNRLQAELSQKALEDYDSTLEALKKREPDSTNHRKWKLADFIKAGRVLGEEHRLVENLSLKKQVEASHAWARLQTLEMFIHDREKAERIYSKTPKAKRLYEQITDEIDMILCAKEDENNNNEYDFWVASGIKASLADVPRVTFVKDEYLNYLTQVHGYFIAQLSKQTASKTIIFPEGQTVMYQNGILSFSLGDGSYDSIDFSTAPRLKKVFDVFWDNKKRTNENKIESSRALTLYEELHTEVIEARQFGYLVSHIRSSKINKKAMLKNRINIDFDRGTDSWHYDWH